MLIDGNYTDRKEVTLKLGENSIYVTATLGTDLRIVSNPSNDTAYTYGFDVSECTSYFGATNSSYDLTSDLELHMPFDRCGETAVWQANDYSGNNNHGVPTNMNQGLDNGTSGCTSSGNMSRGVDFDGVDDYINLGQPTSLDFGDGDFTITCWFKSGDAVEFYDSGSGSAGFAYIWLQLLSDGTTVLRVDDGTDMVQITTNGNAYFDNNWHYFVFQRDGNNIRAYIDGSQFGSEVSCASVDSVTSGRDIWIGRQDYGRDGGGDYTDGTIDNVRIYSRALSGDEVYALWKMNVSDYITNYTSVTDSACTFTTVSNTNNSYVFKVPETGDLISATPTYISTNLTMIESGMNTTNSDWFGQETVSVTSEYLGEQNLTRIRITNPYAMNQYDLLSFNLSEYYDDVNNIQNVWYSSYTGNTDNSTLKSTSDYTQWFDSCSQGNTTGQVFCMNFNELQGTTAKDSSDEGNDGTMNNFNTGYNNDSSGWTTSGKYGNAIVFDGVDDYVDCGNDASVNITGELTISAWVKKSSNTDWGAIVLKGAGNSADAYFLRETNNDKFQFLVKSGGVSYDAINPSAIDLDVWTHIVGVYDKVNVSIFINGVQEEGDAYTGNVGNNSNDLLFGRDTFSATRYFNGTIDEVRIFNRAKSASEIKASYEAGAERLGIMPNQEGGVTAGTDWDIFVVNGSVSSIATNRIVMKPAINTTEPSFWAIDFAFDGSGMTAYDTSCGTFEALNTTSVTTHKNGTYCISYPMENSFYGSQEKQNIGLWQFPQRFEENTYRTFFTIKENLTADVVIELPVNITEILDRTELTADVNDTTYKIYRINENGWVYNDTGICFEQPVSIGE